MMSLQVTRIVIQPRNIVGLTSSGCSTTTIVATNVVTTWYSGMSFTFGSYDPGVGASIASLQIAQSAWVSINQVFGVTGSAYAPSISVPHNVILTRVVLPEIVGLAGFAAASLGLFLYSLLNYGASSALPILGTFTGAIIGLGAVVQLSKMGS